MVCLTPGLFWCQMCKNGSFFSSVGSCLVGTFGPEPFGASLHGARAWRKAAVSDALALGDRVQETTVRSDVGHLSCGQFLRNQ